MDASVLTVTTGPAKPGAQPGRGKGQADGQGAFSALVANASRNAPEGETAATTGEDNAEPEATGTPLRKGLDLLAKAAIAAESGKTAPGQDNPGRIKTHPDNPGGKPKTDAGTAGIERAATKAEDLIATLADAIAGPADDAVAGKPEKAKSIDDALEVPTSGEADAADALIAAETTAGDPAAQAPQADAAKGGLGDIISLLAQNQTRNAEGGEEANKPGMKADVMDLLAARSARDADGTDLPGAEAAETDDAGAAVTFQRANGKGGKLDMATSATGPQGLAEKAATRASEPSGRTDTIFVTESRRFIGLAGDSNGLTLARAIGSDLVPSQPAALNGIAGNVSTTVHTLKLQMHPTDLGAMTASLRLKGDELVVSVMVETAEAYRQLSLDQGDLVKSLQSQGFAIDSVTIQLQPSQSSPDFQSQNGQQGQAGRDASGQASDGRGGQSGEGRNNASGETLNGNGNTKGNQTHDTGGTPPSHALADALGNRQVYL